MANGLRSNRRMNSIGGNWPRIWPTRMRRLLPGRELSILLGELAANPSDRAAQKARRNLRCARTNVNKQTNKEEADSFISRTASRRPADRAIEAALPPDRRRHALPLVHDGGGIAIEEQAVSEDEVAALVTDHAYEFAVELKRLLRERGSALH